MKVTGKSSLKATSIKTISTGIAALGMLAFSVQANAADIYAGPGGFKDVPVIAPPPPLWTGFYAGVNSGAAWSNLSLNNNSFDTYDYAYANNIVCAAGIAHCFGSGNLNSTNAFGGGQLGYNWQGWGGFVFGVEVDLEGVGGGNEHTFIGVGRGGILPDGSVVAAKLKQDGGFAGDITGRLGYAWGNWLLYAKGGFAWFDPNLSASAVVLDSAGNVAAGFNGWKDNSTLTGWTVGAGVEWLLNPNWSFKVEYLYYDFGLNNKNWDAYYNGTYYSSWRLFNNDLTVNTVKLGVNYHLNNGYVPIK